MALVLSGERPAVAAVSLNPLRFLAAWLVQLQAKRAQQQALEDLLHLDQHRLRDLGINRGDLFDAMQSAQRQTHMLMERRSRRSQG